MTTWHITIVFQVPRGAVITDDVVTDIHDARPEFTMVSRIAADQLEFTVDADSDSSVDLFAEAYRRAAEASTDVLGYPVEVFLHGEVVRYDHWLDRVDPNGSTRSWSGDGAPTVDEALAGQDPPASLLAGSILLVSYPHLPQS